MLPLQRKVDAFVHTHQLHADVPHRLLDAVSELGELAKEVLRASKYGRQPFEPTPSMQAELGDVFFSLLCVANLAHGDVEKLVDEAIAKYQRRIVAAGTADSRAES